ncbi:MAG TPA: exodeoxyribonuclease VII large subunit [Fluviicola sp.]|nr:exodeoxyribonuclease VII large subunit [Fluviicola sp.]
MQIPAERFTLKQVADSIRKTIETRYNRTYWVTAEMHKLNQTKKGHCYPELVQKENDMIVVEMRGTIWKTQFENIQRRFTEVVQEPLRDGLELLFLVRVVYHPIYNLGLEIIDIDPNYTLGALQRERQETLERLVKEGILNANQELEMALLPKRLAVISQADSKGYSDFSLLLNGHPKRYHFNTFLFEATLQGDAAITSITKQLDRIRRVQHHFDAVVIIRGGGGEIGMHCYNNYELSKAIATFPLPVLTGIGHSTNMTVCEMVAFNNGITPSDLAYYFLRIFEELDEPLDEALLTLPAGIQRLMRQLKTDFERTTSLFQTETRRVLQAHQTVSGSLVKDFQRVTSIAVQRERNELVNQQNLLRSYATQSVQTSLLKVGNLGVTVGIHSKNQLAQQITTLNHLQQQLGPRISPLLQRETARLENIERNLQLVDPIHVLKRGYSIVTNEKGVISAENVPEKGDEIRIIQADLTVTAKTIKTESLGHPPQSSLKGGS